MSQSTSKMILIIATVIYGLAIVPCAIVAPMTSMVADADPPAWIFSLILFGSLAVPVSILVSVLLAWVYYRKQRYGLAATLSLVPVFVSFIPCLGIVFLAIVE